MIVCSDNKEVDQRILIVFKNFYEYCLFDFIFNG